MRTSRPLVASLIAALFCSITVTHGLNASSAPAGSAPVVITQQNIDGGNIALSWTGGTGPFIVQGKSSLTDTAWVDLATTSARAVEVPIANPVVLLRIMDLGAADEDPVLNPRLRVTGTTSATVSLQNANFAGLSFNSSGGYVPPDTCGAAGPSNYLESVNQNLALYSRSTGALVASFGLAGFFFSVGGLSRADSGSGMSDPVVVYNEKIGRFIVGDQDVDFNTHVSAFDVAVSTSSNPATLSAADWKFYKITTTESGYDADYPGNFGYNADAVVFTLNMFPAISGNGHVQILSVRSSDLASGVVSPLVVRNDLSDFSVRPTTMHDSVSGDPMWLVTEHGDALSIDVIKMTGVLTVPATFTYYNLPVTPYSGVVSPLNPNGTVITGNIDSRIQKCAEANKTIVAVHNVAKSATQDVVQWYAVSVASGVPTLAQQGRIDAGNNTYLTYPAIDINPSGDIGVSYMRSGTDTSTDYMSMWVTARAAADPAGTMQTPVAVPAATGQANYHDFSNGGRAGDLSGINIDPVDGSFWAANEFANTQATANWGTGIANFKAATASNAADLAVTVTGPASVTAGSSATYTVTLVNNGPNAASGVVLTDTLPAGSTFDSMTHTAGPDAFTLSASGNTATETAGGAITAGASDTFSLVVTASSSLTAGANFSDSVSVTSNSSTTDPNLGNNSATAIGSIVGASADLGVAVSAAPTATEGDQIVYTIIVSNGNTLYQSAATGVVLTDTLGANLRFVSSIPSPSSQSGSTVTFNLGTLAYNASVTITLTAQATEDGALINSASVSGTSADPNSANNSRSATTQVSEAGIVMLTSTTTTSLQKVNNLTVATFTHANAVEAASAFNATITWGDGTTSTGSITLSNGTYTVAGSHRYRGSSTHTITTSVTEVNQAAQLLLYKMGDETVDLPDQHNSRYAHEIPAVQHPAAAGH
jgi:uncharacterized repeat protein (TIGR01451 family)